MFSELTTRRLGNDTVCAHWPAAHDSPSHGIDTQAGARTAVKPAAETVPDRHTRHNIKSDSDCKNEDRGAEKSSNRHRADDLELARFEQSASGRVAYDEGGLRAWLTLLWRHALLMFIVGSMCSLALFIAVDMRGWNGL